MFKFLEDYLIYNKDNECPDAYHVWAALGLMSSVIGHQIWITQGQFVYRANLYICLIGKQGNRKTAAKDIAYDIFREVAPDVAVCAETTSREAIMERLVNTKDDLTKHYKYKDEIIEYKPMTIWCTELKNFLSVNPAGMIEFLTTVYDRKFYDAHFRTSGVQTVVNPYIVFIACETPEWIVNKLKEATISGGFSRRVLYVYETRYGKRIPRPKLDSESLAALVRVKEHLVKMRNVVGEFDWTDEAIEWYDAWYISVKPPSDPLLEGFYSSKHAQLMKVAMLAALMDQPFSTTMQKAHLEFALSVLDKLEENYPKLSEAVGTNFLAVPTSRLVEFLDAAGGCLPEKKLQSMMWRDMPTDKFVMAINHLEKTEQIRKVTETMSNGIIRTLIVTQTWIKKKQEEGKITDPPRT